MGRKQRNSTSINKAERRLDGARAIALNLNLGHGFSVSEYEARIAEVRIKLAEYNVARTKAEAAQTALVEAERSLNDYSAHFLLSIASNYGKDSNEYELAGGTRKVDRRKTRSGSKSSESATEEEEG